MTKSFLRFKVKGIIIRCKNQRVKEIRFWLFWTKLFIISKCFGPCLGTVIANFGPATTGQAVFNTKSELSLHNQMQPKSLFGFSWPTFWYFWIQLWSLLGAQKQDLDLLLDPLCLPIAFGILVCGFSIQNYENLLQK